MIKIFGRIPYDVRREFEDGYDEKDDIDEGILCFHCGKYNEPVRGDYKCKYCFFPL